MPLTANRPPPVFDSGRRSAQPEILDGPVESAELADILRDLARFNGAMLGHWPVLRWLERAARRCAGGQPLTLLDIGCGYGDLLRAVRRWARKRGRTMKLIGIDFSPQVVEIARDATEPRRRDRIPGRRHLRLPARRRHRFRRHQPGRASSARCHDRALSALDGGVGAPRLDDLRPAAQRGAVLFHRARRRVAAPASGRRL